MSWVPKWLRTREDSNPTRHEEHDEFPRLKNDRILKAAKGESLSMAPVWIYGQASEYLPAIREMRKNYTFDQLCEDPELCSEATLEPLDMLKFDAAFIYGDFLVVTKAMGMKIKMVPNEGPVYEHRIEDVADMNRLKHINAAVDLKYVMDSIRLIRHNLKGTVPLFGFSGAPWTLMAFMIDGRFTRTWMRAKKWLYTEPEASKKLLHKLEDAIIDYMVEMAKAGAQALHLFDAGAAVLTEAMFLDYVTPGYTRINEAIREKLGHKCPPLFLFAQDLHFYLPHVRDCGFDVIGVDWRIPPKKARELLGHNITIQGNLDPCLLYADDEHLKKMAVNLVKDFGKRRFIANLGENILHDTDPDKVKIFIHEVHHAKFWF